MGLQVATQKTHHVVIVMVSQLFIVIKGSSHNGGKYSVVARCALGVVEPDVVWRGGA